jgi:hypothetical protein
MPESVEKCWNYWKICEICIEEIRKLTTAE